ncbi:MAG: cyclic nucleotide-binding domain-containing protein, partial [Magnetococcales bacterium]|nr:cyclic nucleotide-binding domain-containing protein [Magnetococcales bacterium]
MNLMDFICRIPLFQSLSLGEKRRIAESEKTFIRFDAGEFVIREGANSSGFFVLISGTVKVTRNDLPNKVIALLRAGTIFGEMAFLTGQRRSTNVIANEDGVVVMKLDNQVMAQMSGELRDKIKDKLIELLVKRLN